MQIMTDVSSNRVEEIRTNYEAFRKVLPELLKNHAGKFALMRHAKVEGIFDTARDAYSAGEKLYPDSFFSIQEIVDTPVDLGFYSLALP